MAQQGLFAQLKCEQAYSVIAAAALNPHDNQPDDQTGQAQAGQPSPTARVAMSLGMVLTIVLVGSIAPLATDMYVPAFPRVAAELVTSATAVNLTLTTFFIGMALGQLVGGPVSDARGRRQLLLFSLAVLTVASVVCAVAPSIALMTLARLVQGFSGGWAMVVSRAVVVDLSSGASLVRTLNVISAIGGLAPITAPLLGGLILQFTHWRVSFWALAALSAAMVVAVAALIPESLPPSRRHTGGLRGLLGATGVVLSNRRYVGYLVIVGCSMGSIFCYVSTSAFILQSMNGMTPMHYSIDFAGNAVGLMVATLLSARLAGVVSTRLLIGLGLAGTLIAGSVMMASTLWFNTGKVWAMVAFALLMFAQGFIGSNAGALGSAEVMDHPGTGSALLGFSQWVMAGVIAPLAGLGADRTAIPMAALMLALAVIGLLALLVLTRSARPSNSSTS